MILNHKSPSIWTSVNMWLIQILFFTSHIFLWQRRRAEFRALHDFSECSKETPGGGRGLVIKSCLTLVIPWTAAHQAPLSMEFSRQEYCNGLPFPFPGDLPDPGIEPRSPALQAVSLLTELPGKPKLLVCLYLSWWKKKMWVIMTFLQFHSLSFLNQAYSFRALGEYLHVKSFPQALWQDGWLSEWMIWAPAD